MSLLTVLRLWCAASLILLLTVVAGFAHQIPDDAKDFARSEECSRCHPAIYKEWSASMHSISSPFKDKAHMALYKKYSEAMEKAGKTPDYHCGSCHTPMADNLLDLMSGKAGLNGSDWRQTEGVGCSFCHRIELVVHMPKFNQYRIVGDESYGVGSPPKDAPHMTRQSKVLASEESCMGCHSHLYTGRGVPACVMKEEGMENCLKCHMPQATGPASIDSQNTTHLSHNFSGGHDIEMLKKAVSVEVNIENRGDKPILSVVVANRINHSFPSTNPLRMAFIKAVISDAKGKVVWSNFKESPMEDKTGLFFKTFKAGDTPGVPTWEATDVAFDKRLKAGESRMVSYPVPAVENGKLTVELIYRLFPPPAIKMMGIPQDGINEKNYVIFRKELSL